MINFILIIQAVLLALKSAGASQLGWAATLAPTWLPAVILLVVVGYVFLVSRV